MAEKLSLSREGLGRSLTPAKLETIGMTEEEYLALSDTTLGDDLLGELRFCGFEKPPRVSDEAWNRRIGEAELSPRQKKVVYLAALGRSNSAIAEELNYDIATVQRIISLPGVRSRIAHKQEMLFQNDVKGHVRTLMNKAYGTLDEILSNDEEKASVRLEAAKYVIDRVAGKATQTVDVKVSLLGEFMRKLDSQEREVQGILNTPVEPEYVEAEVTESVEPVVATAKESLVEVKEDMDNLVDQLVQSDFVVGKRGGAVG
jgi:hypothetical protein